MPFKFKRLTQRFPEFKERFHGVYFPEPIVRSQVEERVPEPFIDENIVRKQMLDTHRPDETDVDVKPLVHIVEEILRHASMNRDEVVDTDVRKFHQMRTILMLNSFAHLIDKVACEMSSKCLTGENRDTCVLSLFHTVGNYNWDAKLALILAAFVLKYGEFWLLAQISSSDQLAKSMAVLRRVPMTMEHSSQISSSNQLAKSMAVPRRVPMTMEPPCQIFLSKQLVTSMAVPKRVLMTMEHSTPLEPIFDAVNELIHSVIEFTRCIIQFKMLPSKYINSEVPAMARALSTFPIAAYWIVRGIVVCVEHITRLTGMGNKHKTSSSTWIESWELSFNDRKIINLHEVLKHQLEECHAVIGERKEMYFRKLIDELLVTPDTDNMKILKILLNMSEDPLPLFDGRTKIGASLEVLRKRTVVLLISRLDMSYDELDILEYIWVTHIQGLTMNTLYDLVWVPLVEPYIEYTDAMHMQFEEKRKTMPWYSVSHPSNIDRAVKKSIGDRWCVGNKPVLVVLDPQGREVNPNAMHMMWIWGSTAFPFTIAREEALWRDETWRLELLVCDMDPTIIHWVSQDKCILLFGGDELERIRRLTKDVMDMSTDARIPLETAYVGISKNIENVRRVITIINEEKLSYCWQDINLIRFFWIRLESMLLSKIQHKRANDQDVIMLQLKKLVSYNNVGSWALLCKGSQILAIGHASTMQIALAEFENWNKDIPSKGFNLAFKDYYDKVHISENNSCRIEFPIDAGAIPERMRCPECDHFMDKYMDFLCFHDKPGPPEPF